MAKRKRNVATRNAEGRQALIHRQEVLAQMHSGPLPQPADLGAYEEVLPGLAERITAMAEEQGRHRRALEAQVTRSNTKAQMLGIILGFVVAMTAILGGIYLVAIGKRAEGLASIVVPLVSLAGVFVYGRQAQLRERRQMSVAK